MIVENVLNEDCAEYQLSVKYTEGDGTIHTKTVVTTEPDDIIRMLLLSGMASQGDITVTPLHAEQEMLAQEDMEYDNGYTQTDVDQRDYHPNGWDRNSADYFGRVNDHGNNPLFVESEQSLYKKLKEEFRKYKKEGR